MNAEELKAYNNILQNSNDRLRILKDGEESEYINAEEIIPLFLEMTETAGVFASLLSAITERYGEIEINKSEYLKSAEKLQDSEEEVIEILENNNILVRKIKGV